jgi:hypothetical protein
MLTDRLLTSIACRANYVDDPRGGNEGIPAVERDRADRTRATGRILVMHSHHCELLIATTSPTIGIIVHACHTNVSLAP